MQPLSTAAIISYILFAVAVLIKLYLLIKLFFKRREKRLVRTQPIYGALMMVGGIFLDATCFVLPGVPTIPRCLFSQAWVPLGFTIFYSPLAFKTFRVWQQLGSADLATSSADGDSCRLRGDRVWEDSRIEGEKGSAEARSKKPM